MIEGSVGEPFPGVCERCTNGVSMVEGCRKRGFKRGFKRNLNAFKRGYRANDNNNYNMNDLMYN